MKTSPWRTVSFLLLLAGALFLFGSCVLRGTGTINVRNNLSGGRQITALYIYPTGSPDSSNEIDEPLLHDEVHWEYLVAPGPTTVHAVLDSGAHAEESVTVKENTIYPLLISDIDIL